MPKAKDNLIYLAVGMGLAMLLAGYIFYFDNQGSTIPDIPVGPFWLAASTLFLFGWIILGARKRHINVQQYLPFAAAVGIAHAFLTAIVLHATSRPPVVVLALAIGIEASLSISCIKRLDVWLKGRSGR